MTTTMSHGTNVCQSVRIVLAALVCLSVGLTLSGCGTGGLAVKRDVWEAEEILAIRPDFSAEAWLESHPMTDEGQIRQLVAALADLGL